MEIPSLWAHRVCSIAFHAKKMKELHYENYFWSVH